ncbi:MAG: ABC transporter ATP-binding protein [Myxococcales bacterium]|nr:ABC transporter ATP-binding protein [Myxococcales bacterium]MDD9971933.1 ABC transporter ATP-binding protein [Myxococcales bacterium]
MIRLEGVSRTYGQGPGAVHALRDVSLTIETGTFVTIVGASGSGKSTLLNVLGLLDTPSRGTLFMDGVDVATLDDDGRTQLRRDKIGFIFQFFNLLPTMTALENVALPGKLAGQKRAWSHVRAEALLEHMGLGDRKGHRPSQLSGGEMQRVAIARALMLDPPLLLADEPTGNLDSDTGAAILKLLRGAKANHQTVVMVTHDPKVAGQGERMLTVADGRIVSDEAIANR